MKKIFLVLAGILLISSPSLALELNCIPNATVDPIGYNCTELGNATSTLTLNNINNTVNNIISNMTTFQNGTNASSFGYLLGQVVAGALTDYKNITDNYNNCTKWLDLNKTELSMCQLNLSTCNNSLALKNVIQQDLITCQAEKASKDAQISSFIGNITNIQSQCASNTLNMVPRSELTACQTEKEGNNLYYVIAAIIGAAAYHFLIVKRNKKPEEDMSKRSGDAMRERGI
jgi:hypothetical protein